MRAYDLMSGFHKGFKCIMYKYDPNTHTDNEGHIPSTNALMTSGNPIPDGISVIHAVKDEIRAVDLQKRRSIIR